MATAQPIFIHSLFRSASTDFLQKFRTNEACSCYQEPVDDSLASHYFAASQVPSPQRTWLAATIGQASSRPVLQLCCSSRRIAAMRNLYGGVHLHLWREPRWQWWSYKSAEGLDGVSRRIYRSKQLPQALRELRRLARLPRLRFRHPEPRGDYLMFYGLWLDAWLHLTANSDLSINVDRIARYPAENAACAGRLAELLGCPVDLHDIRASGMVFSAAEEAFYAAAEQAVHEVFRRTGLATAEALQAMAAQAASARAAQEGRRHDPTAEQNLRLAAMSLMHCLAGGGRPGGSRWPRRWYPKRLHDFVRWSLTRSGQRRAPADEHLAR